jgi:hypothetical protein
MAPITLEQLPQAFTDFVEEFKEFRQIVNQKINNDSQGEPDKWFNVDELMLYHPDKPVRSTVYFWVSHRLIPSHKRSKKLFFLKSEIDLWLKEGRRRTVKEISSKANELSQAGRP